MSSLDNNRLLKTTQGFTLIELLVVIAIISLLVSILLPSLNTARDLAKTVACAGNMRSIGLAVTTYTSENNGSIPPGWSADCNSWDWYLMGNGGSETMLDTADVFRCPGDNTPTSTARDPKIFPKRSYSANVWFYGDATSDRLTRRVDDIKSPSTAISVVDSWCTDNTCFFSWYGTVWIPRHFGEDCHMGFTKTNELYFDGSVNAVSFDDYVIVPGQVNWEDQLWFQRFFGG